MNIQVHDDTAEATLGLWGTLCHSPSGSSHTQADGQTSTQKPLNPWKPGSTVLLLHSPGWKIGRNTYLSFTSTTLLDVDPAMKDADWLRRWAIRQKSREAINPPFPEGIFDLDILTTGPMRCLYTIAQLDEFARAAPGEVFQGFLSVIVLEVKLLEVRKRGMLMCRECCCMPAYANAMSAKCYGCEKDVALRLNPKVLGQIVDETACVAPGKLLFSEKAWRELLGREPGDLIEMGKVYSLSYICGRLELT